MSSPSIPDPNQAAIAGAQADVANFPFTWMINRLAQTGGQATIGGQNYDFTGLGNADQSYAVSDAMAQTLLDIQNNYGPDYIRQRLENLKQADPQGYAARKELFDKILADSQAHPDRPLAEDLQAQVNDMLGNAGQLDAQGRQQVQQGVRAGQVARGIYLGNAPASEEATAMVNAADSLRSQQQQQALSYLTSGVSPDDVEYRRIQQALSNLGAFVNGTTPEAQFGSLSAAGNGAAPFNPVNYSTPAATNPNAPAEGINFANGIYNAQQSQANPFLAGLSTGLNTFNTYQNLKTPTPTWNPALAASFAGGVNATAGNPSSWVDTPSNFGAVGAMA